VATIGYQVSARSKPGERLDDGAGGCQEPSNLQLPTRKLFGEVREFRAHPWKGGHGDVVASAADRCLSP